MTEKELIQRYAEESAAIDDLTTTISSLRRKVHAHEREMLSLEQEWLKTHKCACGLLDVPCCH